MPPPSSTSIAIVGAGLCGLALAHQIQDRGLSVTLLEARDRSGGRVFSPRAANGQRYDLGPAWIWPHNPRLLALAQHFDLPLLSQHATGRLVFEDASGAIRRDLDFATMGDALRIAGGIQSLTDAFTSALRPGTLQLGQAVTGITLSTSGVTLTTRAGNAIMAERVVLALPPRIAATLPLSPALPAALIRQMAATPTWMAGHGKVVATFDTPFWRHMGLSGDAISHRGPLMEVHDASATADGGGAALFGFLGPNAARDPEHLRPAAVAQLQRLFGPQAPPSDVLIQDWAAQPETATPADQELLTAHPTYTPLPIVEGPWAGRLFLSGSESAPDHGGFLEGALEAADATAAAL